MARSRMNHYDLLEVAQSASTEEIRHAYFIKAQLVHPDKHAGAPAPVLAEAGRVMRQLNEAWAVLQDPSARRSYDERLGLVESVGRATRPEWAPGTSTTYTGLVCQFCSGAPAIQVKFAAEKGRILFRILERAEGRLCRNCAQGIGRHMTNTTLLQGWWGYISFIVTFFVLARDFASLWRVSRLNPPSWPNGPGALRTLDPGRPIYARPGAILVAIIVGVGILASVLGSGSGSAPPPANAPAYVSQPTSS